MRGKFGLVAAMVAASGLGTVSPREAEAPSGASSATARPAGQAQQALRHHPDAAFRGPHDKFRVLATLTDSDDASHVRMRRVYRGVPVVGGQVIVHNGPRGTFRGADTTISRPLHPSTEPSVSKSRARHLSRRRASGTVSDVSTPHLVVDVSGTPRLAWDATVTGTKSNGWTPSRLRVLVDASTGECRIAHTSPTGRDPADTSILRRPLNPGSA